jgi:hypothetical protein
MVAHHPKKQLDQVRACPELAEGMPSASSNMPHHREDYRLLCHQFIPKLITLKSGWIGGSPSRQPRESPSVVTSRV